MKKITDKIQNISKRSESKNISETSRNLLSHKEYILEMLNDLIPIREQILRLKSEKDFSTKNVIYRNNLNHYFNFEYVRYSQNNYIFRNLTKILQIYLFADKDISKTHELVLEHVGKIYGVVLEYKWLKKFFEEYEDIEDYITDNNIEPFLPEINKSKHVPSSLSIKDEPKIIEEKVEKEVESKPIKTIGKTVQDIIGTKKEIIPKEKVPRAKTDIDVLIENNPPPEGFEEILPYYLLWDDLFGNRTLEFIKKYIVRENGIIKECRVFAFTRKDFESGFYEKCAEKWLKILDIILVQMDTGAFKAHRLMEDGTLYQLEVDGAKMIESFDSSYYYLGEGNTSYLRLKNGTWRHTPPPCHKMTTDDENVWRDATLEEVGRLGWENYVSIPVDWDKEYGYK